MAYSWRDHVQVHPACQAIPPMSDGELSDLARDIATNGLIQPIVLWRVDENAAYQLLDGRSRLDAMALLGDGEERIKSALARPIYKMGPGCDPWQYSVSVNLQRRNLTLEQRRAVIAKVLHANPNRSDRAIARDVKADHKTVSSVRRQQEDVGNIPHVSARSDTLGRHQPAHRTVPAAPPPTTAAPRPAARPAPPQPAAAPPQPAPPQEASPAEQLIAVIAKHGDALRGLVLADRVALARAFLAKLDIEPADLQGAKPPAPSEPEAAEAEAGAAAPPPAPPQAPIPALSGQAPAAGAARPAAAVRSEVKTPLLRLSFELARLSLRVGDRDEMAALVKFADAINKSQGDELRRRMKHQPIGIDRVLVDAFQRLSLYLRHHVVAVARELGFADDLALRIGELPEPEPAPTPKRPPEPMWTERTDQPEGPQQDALGRPLLFTE